MKLLAIPALALCMLVLVACAEGTSPTPDAAITEATHKVEASVEGMTCTGCTGEVVAAVEAIDGVTAAHADVKTGGVQVALTDDADAEATMAEVKSVIAGLSDGKYTVKTIAVSTADHAHPHAEGEAKCCGKCGGDKTEPCPEGCTKDCCKDKADGDVVTACPEGCTKECCQKADGESLTDQVSAEVEKLTEDINVPALGGE